MSLLLLGVGSEDTATSGYDPDAAAYFARMSPDEPTAFKNAVNTFVLALKAASLWTGMDRLGIFCTTNAANALFDLRGVTKTYELFGTTTFTTERGIAGNGTDGYISFREAFQAAGNSFAQNSACVAAWCNDSLDDGTASHPHIGTVDSGTTLLYARIGGESGRVNSSTTDSNTRTGTTRKGFRWGTRTDSANVTYGYNGAALTPVAKASFSPLSTGNATVGRRDTLYTADRIAFVCSGAGLSSADMIVLYGLVNTLLTTLGAN